MSNPKVKHMEMNCSIKSCDKKAFVQVMIVDKKSVQKKIDAKANKKLKITLEREHSYGWHE